MKPVDLDAASRKVNRGYPLTKRDELEWLVRDLVAELRAAREVVEAAWAQHNWITGTRELTTLERQVYEALAAYDKVVG